MKGIYRITSPSNKMYIGQSINIENRFTYYRNMCCKKQTHLYNSFVKYGVENHKLEVLLELDENITQDYLNHCEKFFMDYYREEGYELLNIREGGSNGSIPQETRDKISKTLTGRKKSKEHIEKVRIANTGKKRSEDSKNKQSESKKGTKRTQESIDKQFETRKLLKITHKKITCPHCGKEGGASGMTRYHFDNCKNKINNNDGE